MIKILQKTYAYLNEHHAAKMKILRYIISGGTAAIVDLSLLYLFTDVFKIWYIISTVLAFLLAFMVSFSLQKYWTFKDHSNDNIHAQAIIYFAVTSINLGLNTLGMYFCVQYGHIHYLFAQIIVSALIAVESYFAYRILFNKRATNDESKLDKLLIITQKVDMNDTVLGFFHKWIIEFSKKYDQVTVICLYEGKHDLPSNIKVLSLGKEKGASQFAYVLRFYKYIWSERKNYDSVFVHMNQIYVVLGGIFWRLTGKKIALWYVHRKVTLLLRLAVFFANNIFTSAKESFGIENNKVHYVGHGIDVKSFEKPVGFVSKKSDALRIVSVGRITPIKHCEVLINALDFLRDDHKINVEVNFIGAPHVGGDSVYYDSLLSLVKSKDLEKSVTFIGNVQNSKVQEYFWDADISANMCPHGGMDKVVLESMASGVPAFASNKIFLDVFGEYKDDLIFEYNDPKSLADKISKYWLNCQRDQEFSVTIRKSLMRKAQDFDIAILVDKIISIQKQ